MRHSNNAFPTSNWVLPLVFSSYMLIINLVGCVGSELCTCSKYHEEIDSYMDDISIDTDTYLAQSWAATPHDESQVSESSDLNIAHAAADAG